MNTLTAIVAWSLCLLIGGPMSLIGLFHLLAPRAAWRLYRGWGKRWGSDPEEISPDYPSSFAMRTVGFTLFMFGLAICQVPRWFV